MNILMGIYNNLFQSKQSNTDITKVNIVTNMGTFPGRWFVSQTLRGFDVDINAGDKIVQIRCLEQNPNKTDNAGNLKPNANLARMGHKIMWVIDRKDSWLGRIQDGEWIPAFTPAVKSVSTLPVEQPSFQNQAAQDVPEAYGQYLADSIVLMDAPEISNGTDIPEYVLQSVSEMEEPPDWGDNE